MSPPDEKLLTDKRFNPFFCRREMLRLYPLGNVQIIPAHKKTPVRAKASQQELSSGSKLNPTGVLESAP